MNEIELEIAMLIKFIDQHKLADGSSSKCDRELDMREVLKEIIGDESQDLEYDARLWLNRLAPPSRGKSKGVLRPCSDGNVLNTTHKFHARAFTDAINDQPAPAWDRISELEEKIKAMKNEEISNDREKSEEVLLLSPNIYGIGFDLKGAWKRLVRWIKK